MLLAFRALLMVPAISGHPRCHNGAAPRPRAGFKATADARRHQPDGRGSWRDNIFVEPTKGLVLS